ncbi:MAG: M4 family metallopeptidase [Blastocatellia bacterium]
MRRVFPLVLAGALALAFCSFFFTETTAQTDRGRRGDPPASPGAATRGVRGQGLQAESAHRDDLGRTHTRFAQVIDNIRVYGRELITHQLANGRFEEPTSNLFQGNVPATEPRLSEPGARGIAGTFFGDLGADLAIELVIYPVGNTGRLAFVIDIGNLFNDNEDPRRERMVIDALTGEMIDRWNNLQTGAATGSGFGFYAGQISNLPVDLTNNTWSLFDVVNNAKTFDFNNRTCRLGCTSNGTIYSAPAGVFGATGALTNRASIGIDAHFFAGKTLDYFAATFGRRGIDNAGNKNLRFGFMVSRTHYGNNYNNAFWDGAAMTYGDGDGRTFRPFDAVDVVAHEMTHGITERSSRLEYRNQPGAANESFSDIFGAVVERYAGNRTGAGGVGYPGNDWWVGEDLFVSNNPASPTRGIRNMADPHLEGDPDHFSELVNTSQDNGGVHINSGIMNKVFYLLSEGGTNHVDRTGTVVTGIGIFEAAKIAYDADTIYCMATDNFARVANAWMNAAKGRFGAGSVNARQTFNAWKACGVTPTVTP